MVPLRQGGSGALAASSALNDPDNDSKRPG